MGDLIYRAFNAIPNAADAVRAVGNVARSANSIMAAVDRYERSGTTWQQYRDRNRYPNAALRAFSARPGASASGLSTLRLARQLGRASARMPGAYRNAANTPDRVPHRRSRPRSRYGWANEDPSHFAEGPSCRVGLLASNVAGMFVRWCARFAAHSWLCPCC